jgi:hypothetical protein
MANPIACFVFYASRYTYLAVMRIGQAAARADVEVPWSETRYSGETTKVFDYTEWHLLKTLCSGEPVG